MNVSLTPELKRWVQSKVESGLYGSSSEVVRDALRLLYHFEEEKRSRLEELKADLLVGIEQARAGKSERFTDSVTARIKAEGRRKRNG